MRLAIACNRNFNYQKEDGRPDDMFEEFDSPKAVEALAETISSFGHEVEILEADKTFPEALIRGRFSFVFNIAEGLQGRGREAQVPAVCEMLGVPYSGSDPVTLGIALDKNLAKTVVAGHVPTPKGRVFRNESDIDFSGMHFPVIIKPNAEGSSKGIKTTSRSDDQATARELVCDVFKKYSCPVLVEEFLTGIECTVGIIGNANPHVIGIMEISPKEISSDFFVYSIELKRDFLNQIDYHIPPRLSAKTILAIEKVALLAYQVLECRDFARVDIRLNKEGVPHFLEVNPLPGLAPSKGDIVLLANAMGISYHELISQILQEAFKRVSLSVSAQ